MASISSVYNSALSGLNSYTSAISAASKNIANASVSSYSREVVTLQTTTTGSVTTSATKRVYDSFTVARLRCANEDVGKWDAENTTLSSIENIFSDTDSYGLSSALSTFWSAWDDVANDPSSSSARATLVSDAKNLADIFNTLSSELDNTNDDADTSISDTVSQINDLSKQIADYNKQIRAASNAGQDTSDLEDSRDASLQILAGLINMNTYSDSEGDICVQIGSGGTLVEGISAAKLSSASNSTTGLQEIYLTGSTGVQDITSDITGGSLGGYLEVRNDIIPSYKDQLDELASEIITAVNSLQTSGYDLNGDAGVAFFTGTNAGTIAVNQSILDDSDLVAASSTAGSTSNGTIAADIAKLQDSPVMNGGTQTFSSYYSALVSTIGTAVSSASSNYSQASDTLTACQTLRDSVSAVSTDEELAKLTLYQDAYDACAKVMKVLDELLETLVDM